MFINAEGGRPRKRIGIGGIIVVQCTDLEISVYVHLYIWFLALCGKSLEVVLF